MKILRLLTAALLLITGVFQSLAVAEEGVTARPLLIDVRTEAEWKEGHLEGAIRIPFEKIGDEIEKVAPDKKTKINLYCRTGRRSGIALDTLKKLGYEDVTNLIDARTAAEKLKLPIVKGDK